MCGIAGIVTSEAMPSRPFVEAMLARQAHRGPDDVGTLAFDRCVLGHRRLSIIDVSADGHQPMSTEDGRLSVSFNGEIYNFKDLRQQLGSHGHIFRTSSDTEVLLHAYAQWGPQCVEHMRGMFAFAIWDSQAHQLFMARDRLGKKPLCYSLEDGRLAFASELGALLEVPDIDASPDYEALDNFLSWGYIPAPQSAYRGIRKLAPGHRAMVRITPHGLRLDIERYWSLVYLPKWQLSEADAIEQLRHVVDEAVRLRLISDVPLGAFLSGGLDSSVVVALMAQTSTERVKTFSIGFEEGTYNELAHARAVARHWETEHREYVVKPDATRVLPLLARHFGEPFGDDSALPMFYLAQLTRQDVTVALTGDGGDENLAGYERYYASRLAEQWNRLPGSRWLASLMRQCLPSSAERRSVLRKLGRFLEAAHQPAVARYGEWIGATVGQLSDDTKLRLYQGPLQEVHGRRLAAAWFANLFSDSASLDIVDACMRADVNSYLPDDLLVKTDITTMACGLEARSPLLDHQVMEFTARLPQHLKLRGRAGKYLLRRAFHSLLPRQVMRRGKSGFGIPLADWLRGELVPFARDVLLSSRCLQRGYFAPSIVRQLLDEHFEQRQDHALQIWNMLMLELWQLEVVEPCQQRLSATG